MNARPSAAAKCAIRLLCPGVGPREFELPPGSTLSDLLKEAGLDTSKFSILINESRLEDAIVLQPGTTVSLVPRGDTAQPEPWRATFGMFRDDPHFQEMVEEGRAIREAERDAP